MPQEPCGTTAVAPDVEQPDPELVSGLDLFDLIGGGSILGGVIDADTALVDEVTDEAGGVRTAADVTCETPHAGDHEHDGKHKDADKPKNGHHEHKNERHEHKNGDKPEEPEEPEKPEVPKKPEEEEHDDHALPAPPVEPMPDEPEEITTRGVVSALPVTGGSTGVLLAAGLLMMGLGSGLLVSRRRIARLGSS